ncbi:MAG: penicillin-insensitive murein endopeptidase [Rhodospirillaceae bacterium]|nr:penicillin-insensitive murein endopeptidase [Rhodospirillaceae bacterium]
MPRLLAAVLLALFIPGAAPAAAQALNNDELWARAATPLAQTPWGTGPQVFGGYSNGCIAGAVPLPLDGLGYTVIRTARNRYWGHPQLVEFIQHMGRFAAESGIGTLMVADMAQPRGGPISGHASHEVGLDVDIWLRLLPEPTLSAAERAEPEEMSMLTADGSAIDPARWTDAHVALYREAATYPLTARIFANPLIKQQLCRTVTGDRSWLARVVPWYGHDGHMHVRLTCPPDSPWCVNQTPVDLSDDGCGGALAWWLSEAPYQQTGPSVPPPVPALPAPCAALAPN